MIVVADAGPLRYLTVIGYVDVLKVLYSRVLIPEAVARELQDTKTPDKVHAWIAQPPLWCEICPNTPSDPTLAYLDAGERAAIALALLVSADVLLMDESDGRAEAKRRSLRVTGTLGVLADAHIAGVLDFEAALAQLRRTNFYLSEAVVSGLRQRLAGAMGKS